jgi:hypothetical protein
MGLPCITDGEARKSEKLLIRKYHTIDTLKDLSVDGSILLKMDLIEIRREGVIWFEVARDRVRWRIPVNK